MELDERLAAAATELGRERFASRVYDDRRAQWVTNNEQARWEELLSEDRFVPIQENGGVVTSSISQPSLVFAMTQHLDVQPGNRVLEIGAASAWSAALMSSLVGPTGEVVSVEIDPELVRLARTNVAANKLANVRIVEGDGLAAVAGEREFDRIVYTVGARDFPASLLDLLKVSGKVVLVHKIDSMADVLYSGRRIERAIELQPIIPVLFVELRGALEGEDRFVELPPPHRGLHTRPFWGDVSGYVDLLYRTAGLRFFFRIRSSDYRLVRRGDLTGFGIVGEGDRAAFALKGTNVVQGDIREVERFERLVADWTTMGLPGLTAFDLTISRPEEAGKSAYRYEGRELIYTYLPRKAFAPATTETGANVVPLRAAIG